MSKRVEFRIIPAYYVALFLMVVLFSREYLQIIQKQRRALLQSAALSPQEAGSAPGK
jgi:peptidoglycan/LPS O-acetylase OafA/YrhL